ncbi:2-amino-4-hydroxy-6-hydroxymethyldihydropteridine diphosphokinase [Sunxiuqinia elliptica]|uniref:2-amino-4-hydroxy-6-hydroxymethyldihydropteridine pyrophosphokinase n=1 Tax=Sunxiuqinia elliptica TaxID=655355 RepID=A0A1I2C567_9BACT|nr:2-amino-4-hydroxy-6-hydroxymethyldihydropteridine diphosphokinase [Sunxiuqinia elliptica]SFE63556.1 2-amino-4-hydroxy-6-hydroxymethyldihydropteridinediphosphokinase [Sunxiuqinia elliptica]
MSKLFLLLGGNQGDKRQLFEQALSRIESQLGPILLRSSIYETEPWGFESEALFWNQVVLVQTTLTPHEALTQTQAIEKDLGRVRHDTQYADRLIDLDLLFYDQEVIQTPSLEIPHPRIHERRFVLAPLAQIAPELMHPTFKKEVSELLVECSDPLNVNRLNPEA